MLGLIRMFRISHGLNMRKIGMTGFVGDGVGRNPIYHRMKVLFSSYLGQYSYSFQGSFKLVACQIQFPCS